MNDDETPGHRIGTIDPIDALTTKSSQAEEIRCRPYSSDDAGRGQRLADHLHLENTYRFTPWKRYDSIWDARAGIWRDDASLQIRAVAAQLAKWNKEDTRNASSLKAINAAITMAQAQKPELTAAYTEWDARPELLAHPDGTTSNLLTGTTRLSRPEDLLTKMTAVAPATGPSPVFDSFLQFVTNGDQALAKYVQQAWGMALHGKVQREFAFFFYGKSNSGKSTLMSLLVDALGRELAVAAAAPMIVGKGGAENQIADLKGARVAIMEELAPGARINGGFFKRICSHNLLSGRQLNQATQSWVPTHSLFLTVNDLPAIDGDAGVKRRAIAVPFNNVPARIDPLLKQKLAAELGQILAWAIRGAGVIHASEYHLPQCASVDQATAEWHEGGDLLKRFADEHLLIDPSERVARPDLAFAWRNHCEAEYARPWTTNTFVTAMRERGLATDSRPIRGKYYVFGVTLLGRQNGEYDANALKALRAASDPRGGPIAANQQVEAPGQEGIQ
ncbi:DNA primase family protein [Homoserinimonas sp. A520]